MLWQVEKGRIQAVQQVSETVGSQGRKAIYRGADGSENWIAHMQG